MGFLLDFRLLQRCQLGFGQNMTFPCDFRF